MSAATSAATSAAMLPPETGVGTVRIFVSHKHDDSATATQIKKWFETLGSGRLTVYISESIPAGKEWEQQIRKWLKEADWLLLLYTGPGDWHWCLYEIGLFVGAHEAAPRLVCVHPENVKLPAQLSGWQSYTDSSFDTLMAQILRSEASPQVPPINIRVTDDDLRDIAHKIMAGFTNRGQSRDLTAHIELTLEARQKQELLATRSLAGDILVAADLNAIAIFGLSDLAAGEPLFWSQIMARLARTRQKAWASGVANSIWQLYQRQNTSTTLPAFYSCGRDTIQRWRPILHSAQVGGVSEGFQIIFSEILPEDDPRPSDPILDYCMTLMKLSRLIRFGIIEPYGSKLRRLRRRNSLEGPVEQQVLEDELGLLPSVIDRVETEGMVSTLNRPDNMMERLFGPENTSKCTTWAEQWVDYRRKAVKAVREWNLDALGEALDGMRTVNRESFRLISHKYCELIDQLQ